MQPFTFFFRPFDLNIVRKLCYPGNHVCYSKYPSCVSSFIISTKTYRYFSSTNYQKNNEKIYSPVCLSPSSGTSSSYTSSNFLPFSLSSIPILKGEALRRLASQISWAPHICRDAHVWRKLAERAEQLLPNDITPKDLSLLLNSFKSMAHSPAPLFLSAHDAILSRLSEFSLHDMSVVCISFAGTRHPCHILFDKIAQTICKRSNTGRDGRRDREQQISWIHLVGAFAKADVAHKELFELAGVPISKAFSQTPYNSIPPKYFVKVICAYAKFGYKHVRLLDAASFHTAVMHFNDDQLKLLVRAFHVLKHKDGWLTQISELREIYATTTTGSTNTTTTASTMSTTTTTTNPTISSDSSSSSRTSGGNSSSSVIGNSGGSSSRTSSRTV
eukprot:GHVS01097653.1.p1 GENE.GHVS01097653.1~~GHVS01097653.1.p1  ORF type:complete len:387 (+),score=67.18 GHVS01097653.1:84-1244(+)